MKRYFWPMLLLFVLAGCQTMGVSRPGPEARLRERVEAFWTARAADDRMALYDFHTPEYRSEVSLQEYVRRGNITYSDWSLRSLEIKPSGDLASVMVQTDMTFAAFAFEDLSLTQDWVRGEDTWYLEALTPQESFLQLFGGSAPPAQ